METFTYKPAPGAAMSCAPSVESAKYGEGYEQRAGWGINNKLRKWSLSFTQNVPEVLAFLETHGGVTSFAWTDPLGKPGTYLCREWKTPHVALDMFSLSCDFEQVAG